MVKIKQNKKLKLKSAIIGSLVALIIFFIFGIVTVLIKNPFFSRMTSVYWYDYVFLVFIITVFEYAIIGESCGIPLIICPLEEFLAEIKNKPKTSAIKAIVA